jgi:hypothetical protein
MFGTKTTRFALQADIEGPEEAEERVIIIPCGPRPPNCRPVLVPAEAAAARKHAKPKKTVRKVAQPPRTIAAHHGRAIPLIEGRAKGQGCMTSMQVNQAASHPLNAGARAVTKLEAERKGYPAATHLLVTPAKVPHTRRRPLSAPASKSGWKLAPPLLDPLKWPDHSPKAQCARCRAPQVQKWQPGSLGGHSAHRSSHVSRQSSGAEQKGRGDKLHRAGPASAVQRPAAYTTSAFPKCSSSQPHDTHVQFDGTSTVGPAAIGRAHIDQPLPGQLRDPASNHKPSEPAHATGVQEPPGQSPCGSKLQADSRTPDTIEVSVSSSAQYRQVMQSLEQALSDLKRDRWTPGRGEDAAENGSTSFAASMDSLAELEAEIALQQRRLKAAGVPTRPAAPAELSPSTSSFCSTPSMSAAKRAGRVEGNKRGSSDKDSILRNAEKAEPRVIARDREASLQGSFALARPLDGALQPAERNSTIAPGDAAKSPAEQIQFSYPPRALMEMQSMFATDSSASREGPGACGGSTEAWGVCSPSPVTGSSLEEPLSQLGLSVRRCHERANVSLLLWMFTNPCMACTS